MASGSRRVSVLRGLGANARAGVDAGQVGGVRELLLSTRTKQVVKQAGDGFAAVSQVLAVEDL
jgi:hypothetical protein